MKDKTSIRQRFEFNRLLLNAIEGAEDRDIFILLSGPIEYGCAIIKSQGPMCVRVFRGYGPGTPNEKRLLDALVGMKEFEIRRLDVEGNTIDFVKFQGKADFALDAKMYSVLMETVTITAGAITAGD